MVSPRRHQREVVAGTRRTHLERMGRRERRTGTRLRTPVAVMARLRRRNHRPDTQRDRPHQAPSRLTTNDCKRLECCRGREDGIATLPHHVPVLRCRRETESATLPTVGRHVPRRALQHRLLCPVAADDGPGDRAQGRRLYPYHRRHPCLPQPHGTGETSTFTHPTPIAHDAPEP